MESTTKESIKEEEPKKECLSWMNQITLDLMSRHKIHKAHRIQNQSQNQNQSQSQNINEYEPYHIRLHQLFDDLLQGRQERQSQGQSQRQISQKVMDAFHAFVKQSICEFQKTDDDDEDDDEDDDDDMLKEDDDVLEDEEDEDKWR